MYGITLTLNGSLLLLIGIDTVQKGCLVSPSNNEQSCVSCEGFSSPWSRNSFTANALRWLLEPHVLLTDVKGLGNLVKAQEWDNTWSEQRWFTRNCFLLPHKIMQSRGRVSFSCL